MLYYIVGFILHSLIPQVWPPGGLLPYMMGGWKGEYGTDLQVFAFSVIAEAMTHVHSMNSIE